MADFNLFFKLNATYEGIQHPLIHIKTNGQKLNMHHARHHLKPCIIILTAA